MSTWREKLLGHDESPNRKRGLTYRLAGGVFGSVLRARATITSLLGLKDERQSPSSKPEDLENGLFDQENYCASQRRHFGDSPSRYPKLPKRRSIFEHDPWSNGPEGSDSPRETFGSSIARRWRDRGQADLCRNASIEGQGKMKDESHLEASNAVPSSPINILPRRPPSPGLLSLIERERKEWLLDGNRRPEEILKPELFRRLKSDVDVLTELTEPDEIPSSKQPKVSIPMPGTNLPLFSPNEDSFETAKTFPGDYFAPQIRRTGDTPNALLSAMKTFSQRTASSETLVAAKEAGHRDSGSDKWSSASRSDSTVVISGEMLRLYDELAENEVICHKQVQNTAWQLSSTVPPPEFGSEQTQDRDLTRLSDAPSNQTVDHTDPQELPIARDTPLGPTPAEHPPKVELGGISGQVDGLGPLQLGEPAMPLDCEEGYNTEINVEFNASPAQVPLEAGLVKEGTTGSPQKAADHKEGDGGFRFTTPNDSPFDSPSMGSTGKFKRVRAERLCRYQKLVAGPAESSPFSLDPAFSTMHTADASLSGLPSSSPRTPEKLTEAKASRGSVKRTIQQDTRIKLHRGGNGSRNIREWSISPTLTSDPAAESGLGSPASPQPIVIISGLPRPVTPPAREPFDLPLRLRQPTPITIIRLDDLEFEDNNRPFVAARLPRFGPPTPEHASKDEPVAASRTPSSLLAEPFTPTPVVYSQLSPDWSDIATPDGVEHASPCPVRQLSQVPWKLGTLHRSKRTPLGESSSSGANIGRVRTGKVPQTPNKLDPAELPSVEDWLKSHNFQKNAKGLEEAGWDELLAIDNKGLMRRHVGTHTARRKMLRELRMVKADHANAFRKMNG